MLRIGRLPLGRLPLGRLAVGLSTGLVAAVLLAGCSSLSTGSSSGTDSSTTQTPHWGQQTQTTGCQAHNHLPDSACTPGDVFPNVTKADICVSGYSSSVRNVPTSEKNKAYAEYGIMSHATGAYEVDHLVSLELGGSNDISNLWPEAASPTPGFHQKDQAENYLHDQVCSGSISLATAQQEIATNWLQVWNQMQSQNNG